MMCRKRLRRKALDKYKVQTPRLMSMYASAHRLPPTDGSSHPEHEHPSPRNTVSNTHFHVHTHTYIVPTPVFSPACPQKIGF